MAASKDDGRDRSSPAEDRQNLTLEEGECVSLSPESRRFSQAFRELRPRSIDEVRETLGVSNPGAHAATSSACCLPPELTSTLITPEQLESEDREVRANARALAYTAARAYTHAFDIAALAPWRPVMDRYIELTRPFINVALLLDIDIAAGATLTLSKQTHVLQANRITIHGNGRLVCKGHTTIKAKSVEGVRRLPLGVGSHVVHGL